MQIENLAVVNGIERDKRCSARRLNYAYRFRIDLANGVSAGLEQIRECLCQILVVVQPQGWVGSGRRVVENVIP